MKPYIQKVLLLTPLSKTILFLGLFGRSGPHVSSKDPESYDIMTLGEQLEAEGGQRMNRFSVVLISLSIVLTYLSLTWGVEGKSESGLNISSPAFEMHGLIPAKYTCDGLNVNPPLVIGGVPSGTKSLALIVDDPDAPMGMWVHWVVWNMNPTTREIKENSVANGAVEGVNDFRRNAYGGPCPPSGTHRYFFKLYALDAILEISPKTNKAGLESEMKGHVLTKVEFVGIYKRR